MQNDEDLLGRRHIQLRLNPLKSVQNSLRSFTSGQRAFAHARI
jgi:hypothetical protein